MGVGEGDTVVEEEVEVGVAVEILVGVGLIDTVIAIGNDELSRMWEEREREREREREYKITVYT